jgi:hypothetical protein
VSRIERMGEDDNFGRRGHRAKARRGLRPVAKSTFIPREKSVEIWNLFSRSSTGSATRRIISARCRARTLIPAWG